MTLFSSGKRAWKQGKEDCDSRRAESNAIYRGHRLKEVEVETRALMELCDKTTTQPIPRQLGRRLLTRLIVLSGGGTTDSEARASAEKESDQVPEGFSRTVQSQILNTLYYSYGLAAVLKKLEISVGDGQKLLRRRDCNRVLGSVGLQGGIVCDNGSIDFSRVFAAGIRDGKTRKKRDKSRGLEIELGAGFGDWIVKKALQNPANDFISVELRADRVGQTFARTAAMVGCTPVDNLCIVGAESGSFLSDHVQNESVSAIYINHPEPPTQTFGAETANLLSIMDGGPEPAHMVCGRMILAAAKCLSKSSDSRLIIVTDNRWYGRLICATLVKVTRENTGLLYPVDLSTLSNGFKTIETFPHSTMDSDKKDTIPLFEGQPDETIGHPQGNGLSMNASGASYFDRLWRSGAGTHAESSARFIIVMARQES